LSGYVRLIRDLSAPIAEPHWPPGIALAPFSTALAPAAHALLLECYRTGYGTVPEAFDTWWAATRHDPEFDAGLCFCVTQGDRLTGFALCWTSAFIKDLAVAPAFRHRGLGEALLLETLSTFHARGATEVALKVATGNAPALRLYHRAGFHP